MVDHVLMNKFRIRFDSCLPDKLYEMFDGCVTEEIRLMVFDDGMFFNSPHIELPFRGDVGKWTEEWYAFCRDEQRHIDYIRTYIRVQRPMYFIPVTTYWFDTLERVLTDIEEHADFGTHLPPGHQSVIVFLNDTFYYFDPDKPSFFDKLQTLFPGIQLVNSHPQSYLDDNYCLLHTINFMQTVWQKPENIISYSPERLDKDKIYNRLTSLCKILI